MYSFDTETSPGTTMDKSVISLYQAEQLHRSHVTGTRELEGPEGPKGLEGPKGVEGMHQQNVITFSDLSASRRNIQPPQKTRIESSSGNGSTTSNKKCYTCQPKRLAEQHIFYRDSQVTFHFDLLQRPLIIITPDEHIESIYEMTNDRMKAFFNAIDTFCTYWNLKDYQIQMNSGKWKHHDHLHFKLKANENFVQKLRSDHFRLLKLQANHST